MTPPIWRWRQNCQELRWLESFFPSSHSRLQICPLNIFGNKPTDGTKLDLNIGEIQGLAAWFRVKSTTLSLNHLQRPTGISHPWLGGGFNYLFIFNPILRVMIQFDLRMFFSNMGYWFNHQLKLSKNLKTAGGVRCEPNVWFKDYQWHQHQWHGNITQKFQEAAQFSLKHQGAEYPPVAISSHALRTLFSDRKRLDHGRNLPA